MSRVFEAQVPNWPPGEGRFGYHALTHGALVDQLVRRADAHGRSLGQYFQEEVMQPHGQGEECYIGLPAHLDHRVARMSDEPMPGLDDPLRLARTLWGLRQFVPMMLKSADATHVSSRVFSMWQSMFGTVRESVL